MNSPSICDCMIGGQPLPTCGWSPSLIRCDIYTALLVNYFSIIPCMYETAYMGTCIYRLRAKRIF